MGGSTRSSSGRRSRVWLVRLLAFGLIEASLAACVGAATPNPTDGPPPSAERSPSPLLAATGPLPAVGPTETPRSTYTPAPTPAEPTWSLPSIGPSSGDWTAISWTALPGGSGPAVPAEMAMNANFELYGWSGGYLAFVHAPDSTTIVPWYSADGLLWHAARALDLTGVESQYGPGYEARVSSFAEGPAGLVVAAELEPQGIACGPSEYPAQAMWTSADGGATWARVGLTGAFPQGSVYEISGSSGGYIARGSIDYGVAVWVSGDGRTWRRSDLAGSTFAQADISAAVSFSGGFMLAGTTLAAGGGCAGSDEPIKVTGALWRSVDGMAWTRDELGGATVGDWARMSVQRISDDALYATESSAIGTGDVYTATDTAWTSADGENWAKVSGPPIPQQLFSDGRRGIIATGLYGDVSVPLGVWAFDSDLKPIKLSQRGDAPTQAPWYLAALGPTGFLISSSDGTRFWLGVPTSR